MYKQSLPKSDGGRGWAGGVGENALYYNITSGVLRKHTNGERACLDLIRS